MSIGTDRHRGSPLVEWIFMPIANLVRKRKNSLFSVIIPSARELKLTLAGWRKRRYFTLWRCTATVCAQFTLILLTPIINSSTDTLQSNLLKTLHGSLSVRLAITYRSISHLLKCGESSSLITKIVEFLSNFERYKLCNVKMPSASWVRSL